jgi:hypothetical protein
MRRYSLGWAPPPPSSAGAGCSRRRSAARATRRAEVARELHGRELVEGQVPVEGADHVIAIGPDRPRVVAVIADAVRVAHEVQPGHGHALAVTRRGQQAVDLALVGIGAVSARNARNVLRCGGRPVRDRRSGGAQLRGSASEPARAPPSRSRASTNASMGGASSPRPSPRAGGTRGPDVRPVRLPARPLARSTAQVSIWAALSAACRSRRGASASVVGSVTRWMSALVSGWPGNDGAWRGGKGRGRDLLRGQAQVLLPAVAIGAVAGVAVVGQDGPDVLVEGDARAVHAGIRGLAAATCGGGGEGALITTPSGQAAPASIQRRTVSICAALRGGFRRGIACRGPSR